ncbi:hypothetical protein CEXT_550841 [Caerostris extrusa]|uniref:Uncharacterized protein n=1 Tax=Caerostris extrusa TaxID=172846 RepID=A0AAV4NWH5_CAEEX|nr:hypothetical protein CEXT_550841 [Caerostris extrusa]
MKGIPNASQPSIPSLIQKIKTAGSSSSISNATFGIHTREKPFRPVLHHPAKLMPETASDFGSMVQDSREGCLEGGIWWRRVDDEITRSQWSKSASLPKSVLLLLFGKCF